MLTSVVQIQGVRQRSCEMTSSVRTWVEMNQSQSPLKNGDHFSLELRAGAGSVLEQEAMARASKQASEAVAGVFLVLCGRADQQDKFTGLQEEMNEQLQQVVRDALKAGQDLVHRGLSTEQSRIDRKIAQELNKFKSEANERMLSETARVKQAFDSMCEQLEEQSRLMAKNLDTLQEEKMSLQSQLSEAQMQLKNKQEHCQVLFEEIRNQKRSLEEQDVRASGMAKQIEALNAELSKARRPDPRIAELETASEQLQRRWNEDVKLMQQQLQKELEARVSAEDRANAAEEELQKLRWRLDDGAEMAERATDSEVQALRMQLVRRQEALSKLERAHAEDERKWALQVQQLRERHAEALSAERDGKAFAEQVAQRLEHELLMLSKANLRKSSVKLRTGRAQLDFQDFSAELDRLVGGGKFARDGLPPMKLPLHPSSTSSYTASEPPPPGIARVGSAAKDGGGGGAHRVPKPPSDPAASARAAGDWRERAAADTGGAPGLTPRIPAAARQGSVGRQTVEGMTRLNLAEVEAGGRRGGGESLTSRAPVQGVSGGAGALRSARAASGRGARTHG